MAENVELHEIEPPTTIQRRLSEHKKGCELCWHNLGYSVTTKDPATKKNVQKTILSGINGTVKPGQLLGILGPSGAGKSTMLDILAGRLALTEGSLFYGGAKPTPSEVRRLVAYVPQSDVLLETMTVRETLRFYAALKLPTSLTEEQRHQRVDEVIDELRLTKCADTRVGGHLFRGISGGEKRRLSIGIELLTEPSILFLDEPTSGLDSGTSKHIIKTITRLAKRGRVVVCTIHQPSSKIWAMFDQMLLLHNGKAVYSGDARAAPQHFETMGFVCEQYTNPADFYLDLVTEKKSLERVPEMIAKFDASNTNMVQYLETVEKNAAGHHRSSSLSDLYLERLSFFQQFRWVLYRGLLDLSRNPLLSRVRIFQALFNGILLGLIFLRLGWSQSAVQSRAGLLIFLLMGIAFSCVSQVVHTFPSARDIYMRDRFSKTYDALPYYLAMTFVDLPIQIISPLIQGSITYWMANLNADFTRFVIFLVALVLMYNVSHALGIAIGAAVPSVEVGNALGPVVVVMFTLFSGFFINIDNLPVFLIWAPWVSPAKYGLEMTVINEFSGAEFYCNDDQLVDGVCPYTTGDQYLDTLKFNEVTIGFDAGMLVVLYFVFRVAGFVFLKIRDRKLHVKSNL